MEYAVLGRADLEISQGTGSVQDLLLTQYLVYLQDLRFGVGFVVATVGGEGYCVVQKSWLTSDRKCSFVQELVLV
jgi:hypothetical protein